MGIHTHGYKGVHGGHGYGVRNAEGEIILKFQLENPLSLSVSNTMFIKKESILMT